MIMDHILFASKMIFSCVAHGAGLTGTTTHAQKFFTLLLLGSNKENQTHYIHIFNEYRCNIKDYKLFLKVHYSLIRGL